MMLPAPYVIIAPPFNICRMALISASAYRFPTKPHLLTSLSVFTHKPLSAVFMPPGRRERASPCLKLRSLWTSLCPGDILPVRPSERGVQDPSAPEKAFSSLTFVKWSLTFPFNASLRALSSALGKIIHLKA